jgi:hypothetical protein
MSKIFRSIESSNCQRTAVSREHWSGIRHETSAPWRSR